MEGQFSKGRERARPQISIHYAVCRLKGFPLRQSSRVFRHEDALVRAIVTLKFEESLADWFADPTVAKNKA